MDALLDQISDRPTVMVLGLEAPGLQVELQLLERKGVRTVMCPEEVDQELLEASFAVIVPSVYELHPSIQKRLTDKLVVCTLSQHPNLDAEVASQVGIGDILQVQRSTHNEVADTIMSVLLNFMRRIPSQSVAGGATSCPVMPSARCLSGLRRCMGQTLGIWGWDRSARGVALRAQGFNMRVVAYDPTWEGSDSLPPAILSDTPEEVPGFVECISSLEEFLSCATAVSVHAPAAGGPGSEAGSPLITAETLGLMPAGAILILLACEVAVDDVDVKHALLSGQLAYLATLDSNSGVWDEAWVRYQPNVQILPHRLVTYSDQSASNACVRAVQIVGKVLDRMQGEQGSGEGGEGGTLGLPGSLARGGAVDASVDSTLGRSILQFMTDAEGLAEGLSDTV